MSVPSRDPVAETDVSRYEDVPWSITKHTVPLQGKILPIPDQLVKLSVWGSDGRIRAMC